MNSIFQPDQIKPTRGLWRCCCTLSLSLMVIYTGIYPSYLNSMSNEARNNETGMRGSHKEKGNTTISGIEETIRGQVVSNQEKERLKISDTQEEKLEESISHKDQTDDIIRIDEVETILVTNILSIVEEKHHKHHNHHKKEKQSKTSRKEKEINEIALIGERHSGTRWITSEIKRCFPSLKVSPRLHRWKHWFQPGKEKRRTLVVAQFRNVYEWVNAMREEPHHSPEHLFLGWKDFVHKPWTMPRPKRDLIHQNSTGPVCTHGFRYHELISCVRGAPDDEEFQELKKRLNIPKDEHLHSAHLPFYELKPDGNPFKNVIELRTAKIKNFLNLVESTRGVLDVQYESLVTDGTDFLLQQIEDKVGIKRECEASLPQDRRTKELDMEFVNWMNEHVDWEVERSIGYKKWEEGDESWFGSHGK